VQSNSKANNLSVGSYNVTVTDALGCSAETTATVGQPNVLIAVIGSYSNISCYGNTDGTATADPSGGAILHIIILGKPIQYKQIKRQIIYHWEIILLLLPIQKVVLLRLT